MGKNNKRMAWVWLAALLLLAAALFSMALPGLAAAGLSFLAPASQEDQDEIEQIRRALQDENLGAQMRRSLEEKLEMLERAASQSAEAGLVEPQAGMDEEKRPSSEDPPFPQGIFEGDEGIFRPSEAQITNRWQGVIDGWYYQVLAGAEGDDPGQGLVVVIVTSPDRMTSTFEFYPMDEQKGRLEILSEEALRLRLAAEDGTILFFEIDGRRFATE